MAVSLGSIWGRNHVAEDSCLLGRENVVTIKRRGGGQKLAGDMGESTQTYSSVVW